MNKTTAPKTGKLTLHRETLKRLQEPDLTAVRGAGPSQEATGPCFTCPNCVVTLADC